MQQDAARPLWFENGFHQIEWFESRVSQTDFSAFLERFSHGNALPWSARRIEDAIRANFKIRVNVTESPSPKGQGVTVFDVVTSEEMARGVGASTEDGSLPPVR